MIKKCMIILSILMFSFLYSQKTQEGKASFYSEKHHGKKTASGEIFDMNKLTCASNVFRLGTKVKVTNLENNKTVVVKVNDTGGFTKYGRVIDLSKAAFAAIADVRKGLVRVRVEALN